MRSSHDARCEEQQLIKINLHNSTIALHQVLGEKNRAGRSNRGRQDDEFRKRKAVNVLFGRRAVRVAKKERFGRRKNSRP